MAAVFFLKNGHMRETGAQSSSAVHVCVHVRVRVQVGALFSRNWPFLFRKQCWLRCHVATSGARTHSLTKDEKNMFFGTLRCPLWSVSHY